MPRVADYIIIADAWNQGTIDFTLPASFDAGSRCILKFMIDSDDGDGDAVIKINGDKVWTWNFGSGPNVRMFQEVLGKGIVKAGSNTFNISSGYRVSDVVLFWQANI